jgi:hypothetical protein
MAASRFSNEVLARRELMQRAVRHSFSDGGDMESVDSDIPISTGTSNPVDSGKIAGLLTVTDIGCSKLVLRRPILKGGNITGTSLNAYVELVSESKC